MTLAERIDITVKDYDPYGYRDSECSVDYFKDLLEKAPQVIIEGLLDQIDSMNEEIESLHTENNELTNQLEDRR